MNLSVALLIPILILAVIIPAIILIYLLAKERRK